MSLAEELYYIALDAERKYLDLLNLRNPDKQYSSLQEALEDYFSKKSRIMDVKSQYINGIDKDAAIEMLRALENKGFYSTFATQADKFIAREIQQITTIQDKDKQAQMKIAGIVDEAYTAKILSDILPYWEDYTDIDTLTAQAFTTRVHFQGGSSATDFRVNVSAEGIETGIFNASDLKKSGNINFENKLKLSSFHLDDGIIKAQGQTLDWLEKEYLHLIHTIDNRDVTGDLSTDLLRSDESKAYDTYISYIDKGQFEQVLANYIMYNKLVNDIPVFITNSGGKIQFKLCSDVVYEMSRGNFKLDTQMPVQTVVETTYGSGFKERLIKKAVQQVGKYQLWYGK